MARLTKTQVESIVPGENDILRWDSELRGFGVRVKPSGQRSYIIQYRNKYGRSRRYTVGSHGRLTLEKARKEAKALLGEIERGADPAESKSMALKSEKFADFAKRYMSDYAAGKKKASTLETDKINLRLHILPALGALKVEAITRRDVVKMHQSMKKTPGAANRTLALVSHMLNVAEKWGLRPDNTNPCRHVEKYKEVKRERFLSEKELADLAGVLAAAEQSQTEMPSVIAAIRLLLFTGARLSEILSLKWEYVDIEGQRLRLPDSKTGAKVIYLPPSALEVLANIERQKGNPFVIVGVKPKTNLVNIQKPWRRIRKKASLNDVRLHDLRHSFASMPVLNEEHLDALGRMVAQTCFIHDFQLQHFATYTPWFSQRKNTLGYEDMRNETIAQLLDKEGAPKKYGRMREETRVPTYWERDEHEINNQLRPSFEEKSLKPNIPLEKEYPEHQVMDAFIAEHSKWLKAIKDFGSKFTPKIKAPIRDYERALRDAKNATRIKEARSEGKLLKSDFISVVDANGQGIYTIGADEWSDEEEVVDVALEAVEKELLLATHRKRIHELMEMDFKLRVRKIQIAQARLDAEISEYLGDGFPSPLEGVTIQLDVKKSR